LHPEYHIIKSPRDPNKGNQVSDIYASHTELQQRSLQHIYVEVIKVNDRFTQSYIKVGVAAHLCREIN
ncbi:hypothetical protein BgiBS90_031322, partial [Biomphalaria glabrata]